MGLYMTVGEGSEGFHVYVFEDAQGMRAASRIWKIKERASLRALRKKPSPAANLISTQ